MLTSDELNSLVKLYEQNDPIVALFFAVLRNIRMLTDSILWERRLGTFLLDITQKLNKEVDEIVRQGKAKWN